MQKPYSHIWQAAVSATNSNPFWTFRGLPDIEDGSDAKKNFLLLTWFKDHYRYEHAQLAQLIGTSSSTLYRWQQRRRVPKLAAFALLGLCGYRQAELHITRRRRGLK